MSPVPFSQRTTPGGYLCGEVASALQKEIRRGNEREALFWASELDLGGYTNYVWKRLRIIASEDVGIADTNVAVQVRVLYENWLEMKRAVKEESHAGFYRVFLFHAVCVLARAPKSRMLDHALMLMYDGQRPRPEIPDYALDKHTSRGVRMGRGMLHFFEEGAKLEGETLPDPYADEGRRAHIAAHERRPRPEQQELLDV